jgi:hypothetical protein
MARQPVPGKRRADPSTRRRRRGESKPTGGKRAYRPENDEGLTPEFLDQLRQEEAADSLWQPAVTAAGQGPSGPRGPGGRAVLAGIDADLRADRLYQEALARLAHG